MVKELFTINKQKVREMNLILIQRFFEDRKGKLRYLGLPSTSMEDVLQWKEFFDHITAVERGRTGEEYCFQHDLMLTAMQNNISNKVCLLRGDMDDILLQGKDNFNITLQYPFDVVSLDYSGGIIYKDESGRAKRTASIQRMIWEQSERNQDFLFYISCNLDNEDQGEIRSLIEDIERSLSKIGVNVRKTISSYLNHKLDEVRLKIFVPFMIGNLASQWYQCENFKPIYYRGNRETRMMNFSTWLQRTKEYAAGRPNRQTIIKILNLPAFQILNGEIQETNFGIPEA